MSGFVIPWDKRTEFVDSLIASPSTMDENCKEWFGVSINDLSNQDLSYISQRVFECECCHTVLSVDLCVDFNDENWCKPCVEEEPIEIAFSEGKISLEEYNSQMKNLSK